MSETERLLLRAWRDTASWTVMERLGMSRMADGDFDHPDVHDDSALKRHIRYRIDRPA